MKRERPADDARRTAIIERLRGTPTLEIARCLDRAIMRQSKAISAVAAPRSLAPTI
jgi:hypothetical protein